MNFGKITLRAPEPEDLELLYNWENDSSIWHLGNTITPFSKFTLRKYIEEAERSIFETGQLRLMIVLNDGGQTIGTIDLFEFDPVNRRAGIGILIAETGSRRKGYGKMALEAMIVYCREKLQLHQLYCGIIPDNDASIKLFTGAGFIKSGTRRDWVFSSGKFVDEDMYQLILAST